MERLLLPQDVAELIGVKLSTIYQWTHKEYIPYIKLGRMVRFRLGDIETWLKQKSHAGRASQRLGVDELMRYRKY